MQKYHFHNLKKNVNNTVAHPVGKLNKMLHCNNAKCSHLIAGCWYQQRLRNQ